MLNILRDCYSEKCRSQALSDIIITVMHAQYYIYESILVESCYFLI